MNQDKNIFKSIREGRIIQNVLCNGIGIAAENFDIEKSDVNQVILKAIEGHRKMIKIHQVSVAKLRNRLDDKDPNLGLHLDGCCYFCGDTAHLSKDCSCYKCGKTGHLFKDCTYVDDGSDLAYAVVDALAAYGGAVGGDTGALARAFAGLFGGGGVDADAFAGLFGGGGDAAAFAGLFGGDAGAFAAAGDGAGGDGDDDGGRGGRSGCRKCGQCGHDIRNCDQVGACGDSVCCYNCDETGHIAWECSHSCAVCRESAHMTKDCPKNHCSICGQDGHHEWEGQCPRVEESIDDDKVYCSICGGEHRSKECSGVGCYKCSKVGHLGKDCGRVWGGGGAGVCYYCGLNGYMPVCSLCGATGHLGKDCY